MNIGKKRTLIFGALVLTIVVVLSGITYAFFSAGVNETQEKLSLSTGTMELTFADNDNGIDAQLQFGENVTKKFKIINTGTLEASMSLDWVKLVNTYTNGSLSYSLSYSEEENGTYTELVPKTNMPVSSEELTQTLASEISVPANDTYYYNLTITLNDLPDVDQTADAGAEFRTMFGANDPDRYRYYTLTVDPNGGTWGEFTAPQTYQLKNNETMNITDVPTKVGSTFSGWKLTGVSAEYSDKVFTMGISNATLVALWDLQKIPVTVNGATQEVDYGSTFDLGTPPEKEGYTFTGWSASGGIISGNTLTVNTTDNITVTPTYTVNKYKYIVYHNKQNVDGNGYTLVGADTDEDEADYNTKVTPDTKIYTGFTSPTRKELTIKAETTYPPVLNKVDYNYNRNKHTLTINPNGGTYNSKTENTVVNDIYYEATYSLGTPTKTGYDFANWSNVGGSLADNTFTMGDADATVTANWNAATYSVTFNANGGTVSTASKAVTYDSTYGTLSEPTYAGYSFLGWYTEQTGGTQVTADTPVTITANQELFAHWEKNTVTVFFNTDKGTISFATKEVTIGEKYGELPTWSFTDSTYKFIGWYTAQTDGTEITADTIVTVENNHTLYARIVWNGCFLENTLIYTPKGYKNIQDIEKGDEVYSYNENTKKVEVSVVNYTIFHDVSEYYDVTLEDGTNMKITGNHTVYKKETGEWIPIAKFKVEDTLMKDDGTLVKIKEMNRVEGNTKVYNFEVNGNHNYFVTEDNILVHNDVTGG